MPIRPGMKVAIQNVEKDGILYRPCSLCKELKTLDCFGKNSAAKNGSGLNYYCLKCCSKKKSDYYYENEEYRKKANQLSKESAKTTKKECIAYLGSKCKHCEIPHEEGKNESIYDFHHLDPLKKDFTIGGSGIRDIEKLKPELDKCLLLCSNCHRILHQKEWNENGRIKKS